MEQGIGPEKTRLLRTTHFRKVLTPRPLTEFQPMILVFQVFQKYVSRWCKQHCMFWQMISRYVDTGSSETSVLICHATSCHTLEDDHLNELLLYLLSLLASGSR